jgi:8-oxo-dGTP pyrophosphatase MutT (NUDIX family)
MATPPQEAEHPTTRSWWQRSAGGVVAAEGRVLLIATAGGERWQLPKGRIEPGESARQAAEREIREETGVTCRAIERLGEIQYVFTTRDGRRIHKRVIYFLCTYLGGSARDYDRDEVWTAAWLPDLVALEQLTFDNERQMLERTFQRLAELRSSAQSGAGEASGPQPLP